MPITIEWPEIALRLALTVVAGTLIGLNRSEHGHSAGLRTTLLVCLAASVSMIQVNLLLGIRGVSRLFMTLDWYEGAFLSLKFGSTAAGTQEGSAVGTDYDWRKTLIAC
jgi:MgtC family